MQDRLDVFIAALERYCYTHGLSPRGYLDFAAIQFAKAAVEEADEQQAQVDADALDGCCDHYGSGE